MSAHHRETATSSRKWVLLLTGVMLVGVVLKACLLGPGSSFSESVSHGVRWGTQAQAVSGSPTGVTAEPNSEATGSHKPLAGSGGGSKAEAAAATELERAAAQYPMSMLEPGAILRPDACNESLEAILSRYRRSDAVGDLRVGDVADGPGPQGSQHGKRVAAATAAALSSGKSSRAAAGRGLYAVAAGASAAQLVNDTVSHFLSFPEFDVAILAYDRYDWSDALKHPWAALGEPRLRIIRAPGGFKYVVAKQHLPADLLRKRGYSHLFLWDDDIELQPNFNARDVLLTLQLAPQLKVAAPFVAGGCHLSCWVNDVSVLQPGDPLAQQDSKQLSSAHFLVETPEMMVPIYAVDAWGCYADLIDPDLPESWGIDSVTAGCLCAHVGATLQGPGQVMLLRSTVAHVNLRALSGANIDRAREYERTIVAALANTTGGRQCVDVGGPLRRDGTLAHLARGACLVAS